MSTTQAARTTRGPVKTIADLLERLGDIPPNRVRMHPPPGTATIDDFEKATAAKDRLCELVDGVLVEKAMSYRAACLALALGSLLLEFVRSRNLGIVVGADGAVRLMPKLVRVPDVAYVSWARCPEGRVPAANVPAIVPDLAIEVLSPGNTEKEMARKRREYFHAGCRLVWIIDPDKRTAAVYTNPKSKTMLKETDTLTGGEVLPGFELPLQSLFAELDRQGTPSNK